MPSTPEPTAARARTPPTPLHGPQYDIYQPYSPRRSTRTTAQTNPYSSLNTARSPRARDTTPPSTAKRARFARQNTQLSSPPSSPASPVRTRLTPQQYHKTPRKLRLSGKVTNGASASDSDHASSSLAPPTIDPTTMLPTPSKTPRKRNAAAITATGRILNFQPIDPNDVMPGPRKIKKHGRFHSMNGFDLYDEDQVSRNDGIQIFTDVNARVPEMDEAEDNPFVGPKRTNTRPQRRSRKSPAEDEQMMDEAAGRDEGVVYVFRGKKIFRRFSDPEAERSSSPGTELGEASGQRTLKRQAGAAAQRPLTRSSIKPRLLFPSEEETRARQQHADDVDEEAMTDIEMGNANSPATQKFTATETETPVKGRYKPATPPTTTRTTRSTNMMASPSRPTPIPEEDPEPMSVGTDDSFNMPPKRGRKSPFDSWQRTKTGRKRPGDAETGPANGKRTRSAVVESPA